MFSPKVYVMGAFRGGVTRNGNYRMTGICGRFPRSHIFQRGRINSVVRGRNGGYRVFGNVPNRSQLFYY